ncbi:hypothetical protein [Sphingosinicella sp.]|uniref:hypothetical protein n=1 Tax=Sphingosinicella sp. TaxID=1917971 RepID=UPI004037BFAC
MRVLSLAALALMVLTAPAIAQAPSDDIVVHGAAARQEIERILREDNLNTDRMTPREVADTMAAIARGRAPEDFWSAYQTHVQAWQRYAEAVEQTPGQGPQGESTFGAEGAAGEAQTAIQTTFAEVERIALRYGARLPAAPVDVRNIA